VPFWGQDEAGSHSSGDERHHLGHALIAVHRDQDVHPADRRPAEAFEDQITTSIGLDEHYDDAAVADEAGSGSEVTGNLWPHSQRKRGMAQHGNRNDASSCAPHGPAYDHKPDDRCREDDQVDEPELSQRSGRAGSGDGVHP
jgi:hypothetical protein